MRFASPLFFLLLLIPLAYALWVYFYGKNRNGAVIRFPDTGVLAQQPASLKVRLRNLPLWLRYAAFILLVIALARPQMGQKSEEIYNQGIDIMLVMDTSTSMKAIDFKPANRYEAAKKVAKEFVLGRKNDRIGIVVFAGLAYTQCPLTADHDAVLTFLDQSDIGMTEVDGTAVGSAIATAANRLKGSQGKSRVMILVTDGRNNAGEIDPLTAAQAAAALDIKIYAIGAGQPGGALFPVDDPLWGRRYVKIPEQELDESTLAKIAETTEGRYFRATDTASLASIFKQIDSMEKSEIKTLKYTNYTEYFWLFLWPGVGLLLLEIGIGMLWLRKLP
jgi:Ca-activated chloride channel family protein